MTLKEKHQWLLDNYEELGTTKAYDFIEKIEPKLQKMYTNDYSYEFRFIGVHDFSFNEGRLTNKEILFINLLYNKLKK